MHDLDEPKTENPFDKRLEYCTLADRQMAVDCDSVKTGQLGDDQIGKLDGEAFIAICAKVGSLQKGILIEALSR